LSGSQVGVSGAKVGSRPQALEERDDARLSSGFPGIHCAAILERSLAEIAFVKCLAAICPRSPAGRQGAHQIPNRGICLIPPQVDPTEPLPAESQDRIAKSLRH
jgi:hypothetical protein